MILDGLLLFDGTYSPATGLVGVNQFSAGTTTFSTNQIDLLNRRDLGQGKTGATIEIEIIITTAYLGGTSLNVQLQGSTDNVTYTTYAESGAIPLASLTLGADIFNIQIPAVQPLSGPAPRYYRLAYVCTGTFTAGAVIAALSPPTDDQRYYPPGVTVSN